MPNTRTRSPRQQGQAIVFIALLMFVLWGMVGLAIDSGRSYVDRRDQQTAVDAAALAAGDWFENFQTLYGTSQGAVDNSVKLYENDLRLYGGPTSSSPPVSATVGPNSLTQVTFGYTFAGGYTLTVITTNTQFNGYEFEFDSRHDFPLAFMQVFGGGPTVPISASATAIVGNQRQTPALLTLSTGACATNLKGAGTLTMLGDAYTNGTACVDANLHLAGNCYAAVAVGSSCGSASYYCYSSSPGFVPHPPACDPTKGEIQGGPVVPAPSLPDPGYLAPSEPSYLSAGQIFDRGNYKEMTPGTYPAFTVSGPGCYFLDAGVYTWTASYSSHGSMVSNELKAPHEELYSAAGTTSSTNGASTPNAFYGASGCEGDFSIAPVPVNPANALTQPLLGGKWGVELTSVRYDQFLDSTVTPDPCYGPPGCIRESAPSGCEELNILNVPASGIDVNVTANAPGARYYNVYMNPNGCDGNPGNFSFVGAFNAPGWSGVPPGAAAGPPWVGTLSNGVNGWACPVAGVTICDLASTQLLPTKLCYAQTRNQLCRPPDDERAPQCFAICPAVAAVPAANAAMSLEYGSALGGDIANENYCVVSPNPGNVNSPCAPAKVTPGAVQFYFPSGSCLEQNGNGSTHVFGGAQYNWIVIYQVPANNCTPASLPVAEQLNGNALTQYIGTIYSPGATWNILGSDTSPLAGQVITFAATVQGTANAGIDFNPNYSPAPPAARLIN